MDVSIIVPAYNEERRIGRFMSALSDFCKRKLTGKYEIIVVDDGSKDGTLEMLRHFERRDKHLRVMTYPVNEGKGYAVRKGILDAKGEKIVFIDADGSTMPQEILSMLKWLDKYDVVVGNRRDKKSKIITSKYRKLTQIIFNLFAMILFRSDVDDNLCGFKGFRRKAARDLFRELHDNGWIFDVEIFYKIRKRKYSLKKIPICWTHIGESKIKPFDPLRMFLKLLKLRLLTLLERKW